MEKPKLDFLTVSRLGLGVEFVRDGMADTHPRWGFGLVSAIIKELYKGRLATIRVEKAPVALPIYKVGIEIALIGWWRIPVSY